MSLEGRCRAVWVVIFETGRALEFAMFEGERAINDGAIQPELLEPNVRLEPTPLLRGPDFESGTSAISVVLETRWSDTQIPCFQGEYDAALSYLHCGGIDLMSPILLPICCQNHLETGSYVLLL